MIFHIMKIWIKNGSSDNHERSISAGDRYVPNYLQ